MFLKSQSIWLALAFLSGCYALAGYALLNTQRANIVFTKKEIQGLQDYEVVSAQYLNQHSYELRKKMREIGDASNLILDPEKASYYHVDLLFHYVPLLLEHLLIYRKSPLDDAAFHLEGLAHTVGVIAQEKSPLSEVINQNFLQIRDHLLAKNTQQVMENIRAIHKAACANLKTLLNKRLHRQYQQYRVMLVIVIGLYFLLVSLLVLSFRNYANRRQINLAKERYQLALRLAEKNEELEKFAYAAAHDLKEPVRTMRCFATLLREEMQIHSNVENEYLSIIENTAQRAEKMINDLLNYTQLDETELAKESCDCAEHIAAVLEDLKPRIASCNPTIDVGQMPVLYTIPSMFRRVMLNLIDNALKYRNTAVIPHIVIRAERHAQGWLFTVKDNGIGIPREQNEAVFEPFRRLHTKEYEGNGIGLTTCRRIIEKLGGKIWLSSVQGEGATIFFVIPA